MPPITRILLIASLALLAPALMSAQTPDAKPAAKKARSKKSSGVKVGTATVVSDDSGPKLISTTGGGGADNKWPSFEALQKAAETQNPDALYELGQMYLDGTPDTPKNITRAMLYLDDAAQLGHTAANFRLGKLYADGTETPRDYAKGLKYYKTAALAGDATAQHNIGAMLSSGRGVKRDYVEGLAWLIVAAEKNIEAAQSEKKLREFLAKYPKTIAAGEARAEALAKELAAAKTAREPTVAPAPFKPAPMKIDIAPIAPTVDPMPITPMPAPFTNTN
ncbi:TPR repeat protein [Ereboglobus sp. PH5-5]|uniref:tetratricopeptide repeat protein n=1 Tax=Ereboglobus sp. PH5-5 TaxID=2940529 RepID=UPI00240538AC|nr:tetratricopeptide repeat protein [Ereboglobus sp. PH5-5]MDF9833328.1 TPR repeat protein [Ereboglobus sp. PH5-5]